MKKNKNYFLRKLVIHTIKERENLTYSFKYCSDSGSNITREIVEPGPILSRKIIIFIYKILKYESVTCRYINT